jgi:SecD/SecF fusion protein
MSWRRIAFAFSIVTSIISAVLFMTVEMNYGIDFRGGSSIEVKALQGQGDAADIRARLGELNLGDVQVQAIGAAGEYLIRIEGQNLGDNAEQSVVEKVRGDLAADYEFRRIESVGPTVSSELAWAGTIGVIAAMFAMLLYIWFRFEWQFGLGAILTTGHDVVLMIGLYVALGLEFNLSSIAAILTVVGYSINDTVVVYDRVRENLRRYKKMPIEQLLDLSMNQTLSRTFLTGITTLFALTALYLFGGEVISSFTLAMIFGIVVGTYSSIFIAGPLLILFRLRPDMFERDEKPLAKQDAGPAPTKA